MAVIGRDQVSTRGVRAGQFRRRRKPNSTKNKTDGGYIEETIFVDPLTPIFFGRVWAGGMIDEPLSLRAPKILVPPGLTWLMSRDEVGARGGRNRRPLA